MGKTGQKKVLLKIWYYYLIVTVFVFVLYGNTLKNDYSLDDNFVIYENDLVKEGISGIPEIFSSPYSEGEGRTYGYRPVTRAFFAVEYEFFGPNPAISHLINLLLYLFTCLFLFSLLRKWLTAFPVYLSFFIVLLFAAHPVHTEVISSLKNREEILAFLFSLGSLWSFLKIKGIKHWYWFLLGLSFFVTGYLTKENTLVFVAIIPLSLFYFSENKLLNIGLILVILAVLFWVIKQNIDQSIPTDKTMQFYENPLYATHDLSTTLVLGLATLYKYFSLMIFPHPLLFYYGYDMVSAAGWADLKVIISLVLHLALLGYALFKIRKKQIVSYGILFYLMAISMFSNIFVPVAGIVAERLIYFASFGFCIFFASALFQIINRYNKKNAGVLFVVILVLLLIPMTGKTISRNHDWKNMNTLLDHDIVLLEKSARANALYAGYIMEKLNENNSRYTDQAKAQKLKSAVELYEKALTVYPDYLIVNKSLGNIYSTYYNDFQSAEKYYLKALEIEKDNAEILLSLGYLYEKTNRPAEAEKYYRKGLLCDPKNINACSLLANIYFRKGEEDSALYYNNMIINIDSMSDAPEINMGNYYLSLQDTVKAVEYWEKAIKKVSSNPNLLYGLHRYFLQTGDQKKSDYYMKLYNEFNK